MGDTKNNIPTTINNCVFTFAYIFQGRAANIIYIQ